jgi:hypothetical protein
MWHSLGKITVVTAGVPVRITVDRLSGQTIIFQQLEANTAKIWLCDRATASKTTGVGMLAAIPAPTLSGGIATSLPYAAVTIPTAPGALNLADFWIDADVSGEGCLISYVKG